MHKINIVDTPVRYYPFMGGVEHSVHYLNRVLLKLGINIQVICARTSKSEPSSLGDIKVRRLTSFFKIANTDITLSLPFWLLREDYSIVHTHMPTPWSSDWSIIIAKVRNKKSVLSIHNDMDKPGVFSKLATSIYLHTFFRLSLYLVDKIIIVNSQWQTAFLNTSKILKKYESKIVSIPNGVDLSIFTPTKSKIQKKSILFVSILDKHHLFKGFDYLLEAMVMLKEIDPSIKLTVVGEGELKDFYIKKAKKLGVTSQIEFLGSRNQTELVDYYNQASVFVLPSIDIEGFGNVLVEAMACKTPVITTNKAGMFEDIENWQCGIIIPPKSSSSISDAILKIIGNPILAEAMGANGRKLVESKFTWERVANQVNKVYMEVLR